MQKQNFNQGWYFHLGDPPQRRRFSPDETWRLVDLPHDWSIELERDPNSINGASNGFFQMGRGYYAKTLQPPENWRGKKVLIEFEGVYMNAEGWLNENYLGRHPYGYTTFTFDLTPYLKIGEENMLRVKVDNAAQGNNRVFRFGHLPPGLAVRGWPRARGSLGCLCHHPRSCEEKGHRACANQRGKRRRHGPKSNRNFAHL